MVLMNYFPDDEWFDEVVRQAYNSLPKIFLSKIENVEILVEDYPGNNYFFKSPGDFLLGIYTGIPLNKRGVYYGTYPTLPDRIILFKMNILMACPDKSKLKEKIYEVLFHEIGHYFGMNEEEIRKSMENFKLEKFE
jgi:predicted Zn-dependent protease with MMP-like domain